MEDDDFEVDAGVINVPAPQPLIDVKPEKAEGVETFFKTRVQECANYDAYGRPIVWLSRNNNWFEIQNFSAECKIINTFGIDIETGVISFTYREFIDEIRKQVDDHEKKLDIIHHRAQTASKIESYEITLTEEQFEKMSKIINSDITAGGKSHPMITFHGTSSSETAKSIIKHGYLLPGMIHPETQKRLPMLNGAAYGNGVYSSPHYHFAAGYAIRHLSIKSANNMVLNLVIPGRTMLYRCGGDMSSCDTTITNGLDAVITKDINRVIPIGSVLIKNR